MSQIVSLIISLLASALSLLAVSEVLSSAAKVYGWTEAQTHFYAIIIVFLSNFIQTVHTQVAHYYAPSGKSVASIEKEAAVVAVKLEDKEKEGK